MRKHVFLALAGACLVCACSSSSSSSGDIGPGTVDTDGGPLADATSPGADSSAKPTPDSATPGADTGAPPNDSAPPVADTGTPPGDSAIPSSGGSIVGTGGVASFASITAADQTALKAAHVWFTHASVGENIVGGASAVGFPFASVWSKSELAAHGLSETADLGSFNAEPLKKITSFQNRMLQDDFGSAATIAGMKFCYIDFNTSTNLGTLQTAYAAAIGAIRAKFPTVRLFHVTPPLVPAGASDVAVNTSRVAMGDWMKTTYGTGDVVFDLEDVESTDASGGACQASGRKVLCSAYDGDGSGHLNSAGAQRTAKAFLYALHLARKGSP